MNKNALIGKIEKRASIKIVAESLLTSLKKLESVPQEKKVDLKSAEDAQHVVKYVSERDFSKKNLQHLKKALESVKFLKDISESSSDEFYNSLLRELGHKHYPKGSFIFKYEEYDPKFYILVVGAVLCLTPRRTEEGRESESYITEPPPFLLEKGLATERASVSRFSVMSRPKLGSTTLSAKISPTRDSRLQAESLEENYWKKGNFISPRRKRTLMQATNRSERNSSNLLRRMDSSMYKQRHNAGQHNKESVIEGDCQDIDLILSSLPHFKISRSLEPGDWFGEAVLMANAKRECSMLCKEDTHVLYLSKAAYDKMLGDYNTKLISKKIEFLKSFTIFRGSSESRIYTIFEKMKRLDMKRNGVVFKEGDPSDKIYFIKRGEVEVTNKGKDDTGFIEYIKNDYLRSDDLVGFNNVWDDAKWRDNVKRVNIALLGQGCCFGEEELLVNLPRYTKAVIKSGENEIYYLTKKKFNNYFRNNTYINEMMEELKAKNEWRSEYINSVMRLVHQIEYNPKRLGLAFKPATMLDKNQGKTSEKAPASRKSAERQAKTLDETDSRYYNRERVASASPSLLREANSIINDDKFLELCGLKGSEEMKNWRESPLFDISMISRSNTQYKIINEKNKVKVVYKYCPEIPNHIKRRYNFFGSRHATDQSISNKSERKASLPTHSDGAYEAEGFKDEVNEERWQKSSASVQRLTKLIEKARREREKPENYLFKQEARLEEGLKHDSDRSCLSKLKMGFEKTLFAPAEEQPFNRKTIRKHKHTYLHNRANSEDAKEYIKKSKFLSSLRAMHQHQLQTKPEIDSLEIYEI